MYVQLLTAMQVILHQLLITSVFVFGACDVNGIIELDSSHLLQPWKAFTPEHLPAKLTTANNSNMQHSKYIT